MEDKDKCNYFPIPDEETMNRFLKQDANFDLRKKKFEGLLYSIIKPEVVTFRQFSDALASTLFTRKYLERFRWPTIWLVKLCLPIIICIPNEIIFFLSPSRNQHAHIPYEFVHLMKSTLTTMAEKGLLDPSLVNLDFWRAWPKKISNIQKYEQKRDVIIVKLISFQLTIQLSVLFLIDGDGSCSSWSSFYNSCKKKAFYSYQTHSKYPKEAEAVIVKQGQTIGVRQ